MSLLRGADTFYALRFLRLLTMPWEKTSAYEQGIIDDNGKRLKRPVSREEKQAYTVFHRLVFNIRKLIQKAPGGSSKIAKYATALYLIREEYNLSDSELQSLLDEHIEFELSEDVELDLSGCSLKLKESGISPITYEEVGEKGDEVMIEKIVGDVWGATVFEGTHVPTGAKILINNESFL